jgi:hypothetical protein
MMTSRTTAFLLFASLAFGQRGSLDRAFEKVPFEKWLSEDSHANFHWTMNVPHPVLSFHQRLISQVEMKLDGKDLETRRGHGQLVFFVQITNSAGALFQDHGSLELDKIDENIKNVTVDYTQPLFVLPGNYHLAVAILDTATGEHSAAQGQFRVSTPTQGWLIDAWKGLPPVEYIGKEESPESWFLPAIRGRLLWATSVTSPAQVDVILNVVPATPGLRQTPSGGMAAMLPTLKVLSETGSPAISETVELIDLSRRRAVFEQDAVTELDWPRLKASLGDASTASIDIHSLSERHEDAQFFVSQVRKTIRASAGKPCVVVVLSKPVAFESGEDLEPISLEALPTCRVIYIRFHARLQSAVSPGPQMGGRGRGRRMDPMMNRAPRDAVDQLEATLKPLNPKVFDVESPEELIKAFAEINKTLR